MKRLLLKYKELILYAVFGAGTTLVDLVLYALLVGPFGINVANIVGWVGAVAFAFITNKLWVFSSKSFSWHILWPELVGFVSARALSGLLELFGVPALVAMGLNQTIFGYEGAWAKLIVVVFVIIINYVLSKFLIFRKKNADKRQDPSHD